ncbi:MAG: hypothetical protein ACTHK1_02865 [Actinomycetales bacterium]
MSIAQHFHVHLQLPRQRRVHVAAPVGPASAAGATTVALPPTAPVDAVRTVSLAAKCAHDGSEPLCRECAVFYNAL